MRINALFTYSILVYTTHLLKLAKAIELSSWSGQPQLANPTIELYIWITSWKLSVWTAQACNYSQFICRY